MKKVFRLAKAEFNKIFYRPSIFILTALLIIAIVVTSLVYTPTSKTVKLSYEANTVSEIYSQFLSTSQTTTNKLSIDKSLTDAYNEIKSQYESITKDDKLKTLTDKTVSLKKYFPNTTDNTKGLIQDEVLKISTYTDREFNANKSVTIELFNSLKTDLSDLMNYLAKIQSETLNFYFYQTDYDKMYESINKIYNALPNNYEQYDKNAFISLGNTIATEYNIDEAIKIVSTLKTFTINQEDYDAIIETYYIKATQNLENIYFSQIVDFYNEYEDSKEESDKAQINEYIANYYSYAQMNKSVMQDRFILLRISDVKDTELNGLIGYTQVYRYKINEEIQIFDYLIENQTFDYNYLSSFNFNTASSYSPNAFDYTVYSMQILIILIIVFTIFYACSSIAGDQSNGTMKMIAIRPYTRNKLFTGKYLSCLMFGIMLILISMIASFVVGAVSYGITFDNCLVVFNSSTIITISPFVMLLMYFLSLVVNLLFYISLAMLISLIFKSNALSVFISTLIYGTQIVLCGTVSSAWLNYTPFGHFDLFKYFGNSKTGFLSMNILPDANFITSAIVIGSCIVLFNIISHFIFKRRDIA